MKTRNEHQREIEELWDDLTWHQKKRGVHNTSFGLKMGDFNKVVRRRELDELPQYLFDTAKEEVAYQLAKEMRALSEQDPSYTPIVSKDWMLDDHELNYMLDTVYSDTGAPQLEVREGDGPVRGIAKKIGRRLQKEWESTEIPREPAFYLPTFHETVVKDAKTRHATRPAGGSMQDKETRDALPDGVSLSQSGYGKKRKR